MDLYLSKIPKASEAFYCRPLEKYVEDGIWYSKQPRGKHFKSNMVKNMCTEAKLDGQYTNHSLRASGATELFQHEVPEKIVQEFTGHRSLKGLRQYEKVSTEQKQAASNILTGMSTASQSFNSELSKVHKTQQCSVVPSAQQNISFPFPVFSPVINSNGNVNFTINISGAASEKKVEESYEKLLEGVDLKEFC